jgi:hypothetical protein
LAEHIDAKTHITGNKSAVKTGNKSAVKAVVDHSSRVDNTKFAIVELVTAPVPLMTPASKGLDEIDRRVEALHAILDTFPDPAKQQSHFGSLRVGLPPSVSDEDEEKSVERTKIGRSRPPKGKDRKRGDDPGETSKKALRSGVNTDASIQATLGVSPGAMKAAFRQFAKQKRAGTPAHIVGKYMETQIDRDNYAGKIPGIVDKIMAHLFRASKKKGNELESVRREPIEALLLLVCSYLVGGKIADKRRLSKKIVPLLSKTDLAVVRDETLSVQEKAFLAKEKWLPAEIVSKSGRSDTEGLVKGQKGVKCKQFAENVLGNAPEDGFTRFATSTKRTSIKKTSGEKTVKGVTSPHLKRVDTDLAPTDKPIEKGAILELRSIPGPPTVSRKAPGYHPPDTWGDFYKDLYREALELHGFPKDEPAELARDEKGKGKQVDGEEVDGEEEEA